MKIYQPHISKLQKGFQGNRSLLTSATYSFSSIGGSGEQQNHLKGQHIRYIPKKKLQFNYITADGPMHLFYESGENFKQRMQNWKISSAVATPAALMAYFTLGSTYLWAYPMLFLPTIYQLYDSIRLRKFIQSEAQQIWLYKNGDQFLMKTFDGMLHKMNIIDNHEHKIIDEKNSLLFIVDNSGRQYAISNKNSKVLDYDLLDRVLKSIQVDTGKFQGLYNRLIFRQTPQNLKPLKFNRYLPQSTDLTSNRTIWKILNRTIYREGEDSNWLRNQNYDSELNKKNMTNQEKEVIRRLKKDHNMKYLYPEKLFYKTHKFSRAELLKKLDAASSQEEKDKIIMSLYDDAAQQGRRGVLETSEAFRIVHRKIEEREKFMQFTNKFGGVDVKQAQYSGATFASIKDLA
eukprot:403361286